MPAFQPSWGMLTIGINTPHGPPRALKCDSCGRPTKSDTIHGTRGGEALTLCRECGGDDTPVRGDGYENSI